MPATNASISPSPSADPGDVDKLGLKLLKPLLRPVTVRQVADEAGEDAFAVAGRLAHRQFHRECGPVLAHREDHPADADDPAFTRREVALEIAVRSEEHTSELQSLMRTSYAVLCL